MSFAEQIQNVKLKKSKENMKDYSDPKLAGFMSDESITAYQNTVLDVNTEKWIHLLSDLTFPTKYCPVTKKQTHVFIKIYESFFKDKDQETFKSIDWYGQLCDTEKTVIDTLSSQLEAVMEDFISEDGYAFVKTSSRSAKDAPIYQDKFIELYKNELQDLNADEINNENSLITCLLKAAFQALKLFSANEAISTFVMSERIYQDFLLATKVDERFDENFVVRKFFEIDVDLEFRGFVYNEQLHALSQYNYLIYSERLVQNKLTFQNMICEYFETKVKPRLANVQFEKHYIIDFAICNYNWKPNGESTKIWVIEINPFMETTDGALFSWQHELKLLQGQEGFQFRITERPKPGAKAMLPQSVRSIMHSVTLD